MAAMNNRKREAIKGALICFVGLILLFSTGSMIFIKSVYDDHFTRVDKRQYSGYLAYSDVPEYHRSIVHFESGKNTLTGYVYGEANDKGLVVIAHGLGFGAENYLAETLYFVDHGWRVFSYDCTGTHESEGKSTVGLSQSLIDLDMALRYIESDAKMKGLPIVLYGHSWGGYAVAAVLNNDHDIRAVASISGFNAPIELQSEQIKSILGPLAFFEVPFARVYQGLIFGPTASITAVNGINHSAVPVMVMHGSADEAIAYDGASIIAHRAEITNPQVIYKTLSVENHNGHKNLFRSEAAIEYNAEKNQEYKALYDRYDGEIPDDVKAQYYAGIDRFKTTELDANFMNEINRLFERSIGR